MLFMESYNKYIYLYLYNQIIIHNLNKISKINFKLVSKKFIFQSNTRKKQLKKMKRK